jgi:hypothetical protein
LESPTFEVLLEDVRAALATGEFPNPTTGW